jgi:two-component system, cell cycle response regulator
MWSLLRWTADHDTSEAPVTEPSDISARLTELEIFLRRGKTADAGRTLQELAAGLRRHVLAIEKLERVNLRLTEENRQLQETVRRLKGSCALAVQEHESALVTFDRFRRGIIRFQQMRSLQELPEVLMKISDLLALEAIVLVLDEEEYGEYLPQGFPEMPARDLVRLEAELFVREVRTWLGPIEQLPCREDLTKGVYAIPERGSVFACSLRNRYQPERTIGIMAFIDADPGRYSPEKATDFLLHFCDILGYSIVAVREHEKLDRERVIDPLTGIWNREYLNRHAPRILEFAGRRRFPVSALFIDLDRFKEVNDSFGHEAGDRLLVEVAARIRAMVRQYDIFVRLGGDEFVLLLPDTGTGDAATIAERVREAVASIRLPGSSTFSISASVGTAAFVPGERLEDLLSAADRDMYRQKHGSASGGSTR